MLTLLSRIRCAIRGHREPPAWVASGNTAHYYDCWDCPARVWRNTK